MDITVEEFTNIIDCVGDVAISRKKIIEAEYEKAIGDGFEIPIKWYRTRKNADIKDALALEGIKRGFSVRAEKVMGALPEYCKDEDQQAFNRFDLSWETVRDSRDFTLAVEIEMDISTNKVMEDFNKLVNNKSNCLKVMVCQTRHEDEIEKLKSAVENALAKKSSIAGTYLLSIWAWSRGGFIHFQF